MFTTILTILIVAIAAVLIYAATRPNDFVVSRSAIIKAPPEAIYPLINDFTRWPEWSPYEKLDPDMKRTLSGAESGKGAAYAWEGNGKAGVGRMEITSSVPSSLVALKLDFEKP
ncbi:MAG: polyketide cyclase, partial [Mesorhizobium sp.]